ncbi:hypothetical protein ACQ4PT_044538 [Festuca glaucescens]
MADRRGGNPIRGRGLAGGGRGNGRWNNGFEGGRGNNNYYEGSSSGTAGDDGGSGDGSDQQGNTFDGVFRAGFRSNDSARGGFQPSNGYNGDNGRRNFNGQGNWNNCRYNNNRNYVNSRGRDDYGNEGLTALQAQIVKETAAAVARQFAELPVHSRPVEAQQNVQEVSMQRPATERQTVVPPRPQPVSTRQVAVPPRQTGAHRQPPMQNVLSTGHAVEAGQGAEATLLAVAGAAPSQLVPSVSATQGNEDAISDEAAGNVLDVSPIKFGSSDKNPLSHVSPKKIWDPMVEENDVTMSSEVDVAVESLLSSLPLVHEAVVRPDEAGMPSRSSVVSDGTKKGILSAAAANLGTVSPRAPTATVVGLRSAGTQRPSTHGAGSSRLAASKVEGGLGSHAAKEQQLEVASSRVPSVP